MLVAAREYFSEGGRTRLQHTLPPLLFSALALAKRTMEREKKAAAGEEEPPKFSTRQVFQYTQCITSLNTFNTLSAHHICLCTFYQRLFSNIRYVVIYNRS